MNDQTTMSQSLVTAKKSRRSRENNEKEIPTPVNMVKKNGKKLGPPQLCRIVPDEASMGLDFIARGGKGIVNTVGAMKDSLSSLITGRSNFQSEMLQEDRELIRSTPIMFTKIGPSQSPTISKKATSKQEHQPRARAASLSPQTQFRRKHYGKNNQLGQSVYLKSSGQSGQTAQWRIVLEQGGSSSVSSKQHARNSVQAKRQWDSGSNWLLANTGQRGSRWNGNSSQLVENYRYVDTRKIYPVGVYNHQQNRAGLRFIPKHKNRTDNNKSIQCDTTCNDASSTTQSVGSNPEEGASSGGKSTRYGSSSPIAKKLGYPRRASNSAPADSFMNKKLTHADLVNGGSITAMDKIRARYGNTNDVFEVMNSPKRHPSPTKTHQTPKKYCALCDTIDEDDEVSNSWNSAEAAESAGKSPSPRRRDDGHCPLCPKDDGENVVMPERNQSSVEKIRGRYGAPTDEYAAKVRDRYKASPPMHHRDIQRATHSSRSPPAIPNSWQNQSSWANPGSPPNPNSWAHPRSPANPSSPPNPNSWANQRSSTNPNSWTNPSSPANPNKWANQGSPAKPHTERFGSPAFKMESGTMSPISVSARERYKSPSDNDYDVRSSPADQIRDRYKHSDQITERPKYKIPVPDHVPMPKHVPMHGNNNPERQGPTVNRPQYKIPVPDHVPMPNDNRSQSPLPNQRYKPNNYGAPEYTSPPANPPRYKLHVEGNPNGRGIQHGNNQYYNQQGHLTEEVVKSRQEQIRDKYRPPQDTGDDSHGRQFQSSPDRSQRTNSPTAQRSREMLIQDYKQSMDKFKHSPGRKTPSSWNQSPGSSRGLRAGDIVSEWV